MAQTPDNLTQNHYRDLGYHCIKVEKWGLHPEPHREDFLGIYDYLAFNDDGEMIAIQTTTKHNMEARRKKMLAKTTFSWWTKGGRRSILHGWYRRKGKNGKEVGGWLLEEKEFTMKDWTTYRTEQEAKNALDKTSPLYRELIFGEKM